MGTLKRFSYDNIVIHDPTAPDPVDYEGGGEGGCTCTKDSYIVFLSNDGVLKYRDGETDVALLPSDIPADNGLISITYVVPDDEEPMYDYYYLKTVELDTSTLAPSVLRFYNGRNNIPFEYSANAGGFIVQSGEPLG